MVVREGDNRLIQTQYGDKEVKIVREFNGDEVIVVSNVHCDCDNIKVFSVEENKKINRNTKYKT